MNRFTSKMGFVAVTAMLIFALATSATAVSIEHVGQADPAGEGFGFLGAGTYAVGPGGNDGQDYWPIDASNQASVYVGYRASGTTIAQVVDNSHRYRVDRGEGSDRFDRCLQAPAVGTVDDALGNGVRQSVGLKCMWGGGSDFPMGHLVGARI